MTDRIGGESIGLPPEVVGQMFPFYMVWDLDFQIIDVGSSMAKICPDAHPGKQVWSFFRMTRPHGEPSVEFFLERLDMLFLLESLGGGRVFRGQIVSLGDKMMFLGSPWFSSARDLEDSGLTFGDFAIHDQTTDLLQVIQGEKMANRDLQLLTRKLEEKGQRLREQEAESRKLAMVAARTDNGVIIADADGRIEWVNEGFYSLTGWKLDEVKGKKHGEFLQGAGSDPETIRRMEEQLRAGRAFKAKAMNYHRNGKGYWVEVEIQPVFGSDGVLRNFIGLQRDVTKLELQAERSALKLKVSLALSKAVCLESAIELILGEVCRFCEWKAGLLWTVDKVSGRSSLSGFWHGGGEQLAIFAEEMDKCQEEFSEVWCRKSHSGFNVESPVRFLSGRQVDLAEGVMMESVLVPVTGDQNEERIFEFLLPVDDAKPDTEQIDFLENLGSQLGQFIVRQRYESALEQSKIQAELASKSKSDFLATMSHEIRTPMNGVLGFTEMLQLSELSPQQRSYVSSIHYSANALLRVINDVLDFSKIESGNLQIERRDFDLVKCIEGAIETVSPGAEEKGLDLSVRFNPGVPARIRSDEYRLRQVMLNLLGNALKFTQAGSIGIEIEVTGEEGGRALVIHVSDTGIGIDPKLLPELFKSFRQADSSTTRVFGGSGLGLAICKNIIEVLGGSLVVESTPCQGSVFSFSLTCWECEHGDDAIEQFRVPEIAGVKVLVIDQGNAGAQCVADAVGRWKIKLCISDGLSEGLEAIADFCPDVILLDGGFAFHEISDFVRHPLVVSARLYMMVRRKDEDVVRGAFADLFTGLLVKPVRLGSLFEAMTSPVEAPLLAGGSPTLKKAAEPAGNGDNRYLGRILLVEDNPVNRKFALAALEHLGLGADVAENGLAALEAAERREYDVILMDIHLPKMDGLAATRCIREKESESGRRRAKIIGVTADAISGSEESCIAAGMDGYLSKPLSIMALGSALEEVVVPANAGVDLQVDRWQNRDPRGALLSWSSELSGQEICSLADDFASDLPAACDEIAAAIREGDLGVVQRHAHTLKGTASIFCLRELIDLACRIEDRAHEGDADKTAQLLSELGEVAQRGARELEAAVAEFRG